MSSDRRILALGLVALTTSACMSRQGTEPPAFPEGGLVARGPAPDLRAAPAGTPYENLVPVLSVLDGVYETSEPFRNPVVVTPAVGRRECRER